MKTIGVLGGMSWESTANYYRLINEGVKARLGGLHSARLIVYSVDFDGIAAMQRDGDWDGAAHQLTAAACALQSAGADFLLIATNTMHCVAEQIQAGCALPLLHIADATAEAIKRAGINRVGLLGTRFTMEQDFYRARLADRHGLTVLVPDAAQRGDVHRIIYDELCLGRIEPASREAYRRIMVELVAQGAQAIILGCTEIALLVGPEDAGVPLFDTTALHAQAAVEEALA